jgi:methyltransferase (TIGR00027 family)
MKPKDTVDTKGAAKTGDGPTLTVAIEQNFPSEKRIIQDDLAARLFTGSNRFWITFTKITAVRNWLVNLTEKMLSGGWSFILVRKRYIDERLIEAIAEKKVNAIVNLGAGFDTRLYRLSELKHIPAWEVDQAVNINAKRKGLQRALKALPGNVKLVSINFIEEEIGGVLKQQGYPENEKTFFIWEAVSQYLNEAAVQKTLDFFAKAPAGSRLAFTYVLKDFITGKNLFGQEMIYKRFVLKNKLWHFGFDPDQLAAFLNKNGWQLIEDLGYAELGDRYVKPTKRSLGVLEIERMVYAEKL